MTDLLAATLNASLPGAEREVYTRGGRSDLFIRADTLSEGAAPAKVFICESKWWRGQAAAAKALGQLFRYLEIKDTAAVLVFFVAASRPSKVRQVAAQALSDCPGFQSIEGGPVKGWPILNFRVKDHGVAICTAFIDLPRQESIP